MANAEFEIPHPVVGQQYRDIQDRRWAVRGIEPLGSKRGPYYVLEIDMRTQDNAASRLRMSSREFFKLAETGFLKPLQPGA
jgi:hypothetical protein